MATSRETRLCRSELFKQPSGRPELGFRRSSLLRPRACHVHVKGSRGFNMCSPPFTWFEPLPTSTYMYLQAGAEPNPKLPVAYDAAAEEMET